MYVGLLWMVVLFIFTLLVVVLGMEVPVVSLVRHSVHSERFALLGSACP
jgi:hypothetical protein